MQYNYNVFCAFAEQAESCDCNDDDNDDTKYSHEVDIWHECILYTQTGSCFGVIDT